MARLWEQIRALEGKTLPTSGGRESFDVQSVDDRYIWIVPRRSKSRKPRAIRRKEFEYVESLGLATLDITAEQLRDAKISEFNRSYVPSIIRAAVRQLTLS